MTDILVPFEQEGTKAIVRSWLKKVGDAVAENDPLVELETDKVTQEVPAPAAGILAEILLDTDDEAVPGGVLGRLRLADAPAATAPSEPVDDRVEAESGLALAGDDEPIGASPHAGFLSPAVRRAVAQHGVDPVSIRGTGRGGRLTRADVDAHVEARRAQPEPAAPVVTPAPAPAQAPASRVPPPVASSGGSRDVPHDRMRLAIAENMLRSVTTAPHVTAVFEADFTAIAAHRRRHKEAFASEGANLTYTAYMVAASVAAMQSAPAINGRWHEDRLELLSDINIGVGTALGDKGLVVPVVQRAQELSLFGIARRLDELVGRAREGRLIPADVRGGTFTISNHGVSGSLFAAPIIIAQPQSAILGVGKLEKRVVVREIDGADAIQIRPMAYVSLTIDHRVVDGHQTNAWLTRFVETLERWPIDG